MSTILPVGDSLPNPSAAMLQRLQAVSSKPLNPSPLAMPASTSTTLDVDSTLPQPSDAPASLELSGRIISATCYTPYTIGYRKDNDAAKTGNDTWEITTRRGLSTLHDTLKHLASKQSGWEHTLVGWTGEIKQLSTDAETHPQQHMQSSRMAQVGNPVPEIAGSSARPNPAMLHRTKSYVAPSSAPVFSGNTNRMTMKGDYSKPPEEQKATVNAELRKELEMVLEEKGGEAGWDKIKPVWLGDEVEGGLPLVDMERWTKYAEKVLWPTFHYIVPQTFSPAEGSTLEERAWWRDYLRFNNAFANSIVEIYKPGDIIWVHDYHLLVLPEILRQRIGRDIYIGMFIHAPWPSSEIFKILSRRKPLIEGMLASNMVCFQSETYKEHFVSCCKRILGFNESFDAKGNVTGVDTYGAHCGVSVNPIGLDLQKVKAAINQPGVLENMEKIKKGYGDKKIIVGRDRLDGVRGVLQKLRAFQRFLENNPEWVERVVLIQVTSSSYLAESASIEVQVSDLISKINGKYGSINHTPVQHYPQYLQPQEYFALLRVADLGMFTSVRDGMNTASLEYIICQDKNLAPIIVSEFTGTAESLPNAIIVNPTNTSQVADQIVRCLEFSAEERRAQYDKLANYVTTHTAQTWNANFLRSLFIELQHDKDHPITPALDSHSFLSAYNSSRKRLFMFDYDGTLTPIVQDPQMAIPADRVVRTLKLLAAQPDNEVWIISGRDQDFLSQWLGHIEELGLSAEHGCFLRYPRQTNWQNLAAMMDMTWQKVAIEVFTKYTEKTAGSFVECKDIAVTWHYRRAELGLGRHMSALCRAEMIATLASWDVEVMDGKANLEVRPRALNKGEIVRKLITSNPDFVFCAGDDRTDEDMFHVLGGPEASGIKNVFSVTVGASSKVTKADWHLLEPGDVVDAAGLCMGIVDPRDVGISQGTEGCNGDKN
ncbi:glycosyltransferase family 20-domain-containing protein [Geopyxis carbonaria]|nr:glycosyltransferase family 20-domain-containing protein [Geopyxis carbonaria]